MEPLIHLSSRPDWHWWMPTTITTTTVRGLSNPRYVLKADNTYLGVREVIVLISNNHINALYFVLFCSLYHTQRYSWVLFLRLKLYCTLLAFFYIWPDLTSPGPTIFIFWPPPPSFVSMQISRSVDFTRGGATVSVYYLRFPVRHCKIYVPPLWLVMFIISVIHTISSQLIILRRYQVLFIYGDLIINVVIQY